MNGTVTKTQKLLSTRSDGRIEGVVRVCYENGGWREFVAGVSADRNEAATMAATLELKLWTASIVR